MSNALAEQPVRPLRASDWRGRENDWPFRELLAPDFKVDRRLDGRWRVRGHASVLGLGTCLGMMAELEDLDGSPWWIGGTSDRRIPCGSRVSVGFSDPSGRPAQGIVMRCDPRGDDRYRIAIRFDAASLC